MGKIIIITGYFYPEDTAIGLYNTQLVEYLEKKGYNVSVITDFPSYPQWKIREDYKAKGTFITEYYNKTKILRYKQYVPRSPSFFKRILLLLDFTFGSFINTLKIKECDVVISIVPHTSTMLLGWVLKIRRKSKLWNHIQDFEFDAAKQTGVFSQKNSIKGFLFRLLFYLERKMLNQGDINSTISHTMLNKLSLKSTSNSFYFPNWIDANIINPHNEKTHKYLNSSKFKILYSGNIGDKQDWQFFLQFAERLNEQEVEIVIVGDGAKREWLQKNINNYSNIKYYSPVEYNDLSSLLCSADLHILFQKNDVVDSVMPSKLLGMMASGKPSLITGNKDSEVRTIIEESNGGFYISDNSVEKCISVVDILINSSDKQSEIGSQARTYIINKFSSEKVLSSFEVELSRLINEK